MSIIIGDTGTSAGGASLSSSNTVDQLAAAQVATVEAMLGSMGLGSSLNAIA